MKMIFLAGIMALPSLNNVAAVESWFVVNGNTGTCAPFTTIYNGAPQDFAAMMRRRGHEVENKHADRSDAAWYVVDDANLVMSKSEEDCKMIAGMIVATKALPWDLRDTAKEAMKDPHIQRAIELAKKQERTGQSPK